MICSGWLKNDSLCLRLKCSSECCVASRCYGLGLDIQKSDEEDRLQHLDQQMHHALVWILSWHCNSEIVSWSGTQWTWRWWEINNCQWGTTDRAILKIFTAAYTECKQILIDVIDHLTRHSYMAKLKVTRS